MKLWGFYVASLICNLLRSDLFEATDKAEGRMERHWQNSQEPIGNLSTCDQALFCSRNVLTFLSTCADLPSIRRTFLTNCGLAMWDPIDDNAEIAKPSKGRGKAAKTLSFSKNRIFVSPGGRVLSSKVNKILISIVTRRPPRPSMKDPIEHIRRLPTLQRPREKA